MGFCITPDATRLYIANSGNDTISNIDKTTNTVILSPISVGNTSITIVIEEIPVC
ncbi:hypothetical protein HXA35_19980 [Bacillus sp. A301a_S52]|nr:hypothetical protein [Bacillus sp. A301a_S52]